MLDEPIKSWRNFKPPNSLETTENTDFTVHSKDNTFEESSSVSSEELPQNKTEPSQVGDMKGISVIIIFIELVILPTFRV